MALHTDEIVSTLNNLIETCRDGEKGFKAAAEHVGDPHLRILFTDYSRQRAQLAEELQFEIRRLGAEPAESGSLAGKLHQGWIDLKGSITGHDDAEILSECERGEDAAVEQYHEAVQKDLPEAIAQIVRRQAGAVQAAHDRISELDKQHNRDHATHGTS